MRKILTLVLLLSFACSEETEFRCESCINMTISDALPIQFWLNDCPTYNEKESCGVHSFCWNQKFHCDDEIRLQVTNTDEGQELSLQLLDENGDLVTEMPFEATNLTINTPIIPELQFSNTDFGDDLDGWINSNGSVGDAGQAFGWSSGDARAQGSPENSKFFATARPDSDLGWPPGDYVISVRAKNNSVGDADDLGLTIWGMPADQTSQTSLGASASYPRDDTFYTRTLSFTTTQYWGLFALRFIRAGGGGTFDIDVTMTEALITEAPTTEDLYSRTVFDVSFVPSELSPEICNEKLQFVIVDDNTSPAEIAKSDFIEFSDNLQCTQLIKYRNQRNFAGIDYANLPDDAYFYKRIPAVFFHEQFPGEDEVAELSDSKIINLNGVMRAQKRLETDYIPYYMHKKIQLILKHQFVEIESQRWTKQDAYEITEGNKRYPLKMAKCWLTERNFVARNVV